MKFVRIEVIFDSYANPYVPDTFQNRNWNGSEPVKQVQPFKQGSSCVPCNNTIFEFVHISYQDEVSKYINMHLKILNEK